MGRVHQRAHQRREPFWEHEHIACCRISISKRASCIGPASGLHRQTDHPNDNNKNKSIYLQSAGRGECREESAEESAEEGTEYLQRCPLQADTCVYFDHISVEYFTCIYCRVYRVQSMPRTILQCVLPCNICPI